jgi:hypothetical protein
MQLFATQQGMIFVRKIRIEYLKTIHVRVIFFELMESEREGTFHGLEMLALDNFPLRSFQFIFQY